MTQRFARIATALSLTLAALSLIVCLACLLLWPASYQDAHHLVYEHNSPVTPPYDGWHLRLTCECGGCDFAYATMVASEMGWEGEGFRWLIFPAIRPPGRDVSLGVHSWHLAGFGLEYGSKPPPNGCTAFRLWLPFWFLALLTALPPAFAARALWRKLRTRPDPATAFPVHVGGHDGGALRQETV